MPEAFGRYTLLKRLASGGMGELFLARPVEDPNSQLIAVKTLLPAMAEDPDLVLMFLDEARLAARLHHPNICRIHDLGMEDGVLFMALEFIHGEDCERIQKALAKQGKTLPIGLAARIVADAAKGLHAAHELTDESGERVNLVHRDISPHNILTTFSGQVKIIDFGLAKALGRATQSQTGSLKGKFAYMSPELVRSERINHRSDVFALGVVLHELLTGKRLFQADSEIATLALIARCEVEPPSKTNPNIPPALDAIAMRALTPNPDDRWQTAEDMRAGLEIFLATHAGPRLNKDLAQFMKGLFIERLNSENAKGLLGNLPDDKVLLRGRRKDLKPPAPPPAPRKPARNERVENTGSADVTDPSAAPPRRPSLDSLAPDPVTAPGVRMPRASDFEDVPTQKERAVAAPPADPNRIRLAPVPVKASSKPLASAAPPPSMLGAPPPAARLADSNRGGVRMPDLSEPATIQTDFESMPRTVLGSTVRVDEMPRVGGDTTPLAPAYFSPEPVVARPPLKQKRTYFGFVVGIVIVVVLALVAVAVLS